MNEVKIKRRESEKGVRIRVTMPAGTAMNLRWVLPQCRRRDVPLSSDMEELLNALIDAYNEGKFNV